MRGQPRPRQAPICSRPPNTAIIRGSQEATGLLGPCSTASATDVGGLNRVADGFAVGQLARVAARLRFRVDPHADELQARSALDGHPESGALSLEWIVIASLLVVAAVAAGVFFKNIIGTWENQVPTGP